MLRVLRPRSPMSLGAWNLAAFSTLLGGAVTADLAGRPVAARRLGAAGAVLGTHLGTYTGALLASTAVPLWSRSRLWLGPLFGATATAAGAAATGLALAADGAPADAGPRRALGRVETAALAAELVGGAALERRLGPLADAAHRTDPAVAPGAPPARPRSARSRCGSPRAAAGSRAPDPRQARSRSAPPSPSGSPGSAPAAHRPADDATVAALARAEVRVSAPRLGR